MPPQFTGHPPIIDNFDFSVINHTKIMGEYHRNICLQTFSGFFNISYFSSTVSKMQNKRNSRERNSREQLFMGVHNPWPAGSTLVPEHNTSKRWQQWNFCQLEVGGSGGGRLSPCQQLGKLTVYSVLHHFYTKNIHTWKKSRSVRICRSTEGSMIRLKLMVAYSTPPQQLTGRKH